MSVWQSPNPHAQSDANKSLHHIDSNQGWGISILLALLLAVAIGFSNQPFPHLISEKQFKIVLCPCFWWVTMNLCPWPCTPAAAKRNSGMSTGRKSAFQQPMFVKTTKFFQVIVLKQSIVQEVFVL